MKKMNIKKMAVIGLTSLLVGGLGIQQAKINGLENNKTVNASKISTKPLEIGTRYRVGGLSMVVSEYTYKGHKNYVITTNLKHKEFYQVGSNDDRKGKTKGVTLAFGNDQK